VKTPTTPRDTRIARLYKQHRKNTDTVYCDGCGFKQPNFCRPNGRPMWERLFHAHHIVPLKYGGADVGDNMALLCLNCHAFVHAFFSVGPDGEWNGDRNRTALRLTFNVMWAIGGFERRPGVAS
jgi:hypothetical protein